MKLEEKVGELLKAKKLSLSTAESCTGGELSRLLTSISGSSTYFLGGITTYDFHKKIEKYAPVRKLNPKISKKEASNELQQELGLKVA